MATVDADHRDVEIVQRRPIDRKADCETVEITRRNHLRNRNTHSEQAKDSCMNVVSPGNKRALLKA
jgi:hypothetical protein